MKLTLKQINQDCLPYLITNYSKKRYPNKLRCIIYSLWYFSVLTKKEWLHLSRRNINTRVCSLRIVSGRRRTEYFSKKMVIHLLDYYKSENEEKVLNFCLTNLEDLEIMCQKLSKFLGKHLTSKSFKGRKR